MKKKDNILVSAIITTYGRSYNEILRSILSVKKQTYSNIEIVLVDDNGTGTKYQKEIEKKVKKEYPEIKYFIHDKNMGAQWARNNGIIHSSGELIAFLDDDDEWLPDKIKLQVNLYNKEDNVGLIYCRGYTYYEVNKQKVDYGCDPYFKNETTFKDLLYQDIIGTTTQAMVSRYAFNCVGYFDIYQPARQDYEMWLRISQKFRCVGVDKKLFIHYMHDGEQISKNPWLGIVGYKNILKKYYYYYFKYPKGKIGLYSMIRNKFLAEGNKKSAFKYKIAIYFNYILSIFLKGNFKQDK